MNLGSRARWAVVLGICLVAVAPAALSVRADAPPAVPGAASLLAHFLAWDADAKQVRAATGQVSAQFTFWVTNASTDVVAIQGTRTSCGCTVAQLPARPWRLQPGDCGPIQVTLDFQSASGSISKSVYIDTTAGMKQLTVKAEVPPPAPRPPEPAPSAMTIERVLNLQVALQDRQAIFKHNCVHCHVEPAVGKTGKPLYAAACGICHDAKVRATVVPELKPAANTNGIAYWRKWITEGRPGSLMPAFGKAGGGPWSDPQIEGLAAWLAAESKAPSSPATSAPQKPQRPSAGPANP